MSVRDMCVALACARACANGCPQVALSRRSIEDASTCTLRTHGHGWPAKLANTNPVPGHGCCSPFRLFSCWLCLGQKHNKSPGCMSYNFASTCPALLRATLVRDIRVQKIIAPKLQWTQWTQWRAGGASEKDICSGKERPQLKSRKVISILLKLHIIFCLVSLPRTSYFVLYTLYTQMHIHSRADTKVRY